LSWFGAVGRQVNLLKEKPLLIFNLEKRTSMIKRIQKYRVLKLIKPEGDCLIRFG
jgi:hypothetical protein